MKSNLANWILGGIFTLVVFVIGFCSAFYINYLSLANTYTKEHVDNGRLMLRALTYVENKEYDRVRSYLRERVSTKILILDSIRLPPTSERDIELIDSFYLEVINYFDSQGGLDETIQVKEDEQWIPKPTPSMMILEAFKNEHQTKTKETNSASETE